jgi:predicted NUDIX family NTP pyrophosphohydrolase
MGRDLTSLFAPLSIISTMPKTSAGILMYRKRRDSIEMLLVHPGGPLWAKKDLGVWSIPKGQYLSDEHPLAAARREFEEETGFPVDGEFLSLGALKQPSGKVVSVWAIEGDLDASAAHSNMMVCEWPPKSGKKREFPEVDRAEWYGVGEAKMKLVKGQVPFVSALCEQLGIRDRT